VETSRIISALEATDRWTAIDELIEQLILSNQIPRESRDAVSDAICRRETSRSTGIGSGIAIPHARTPVVSEVAWAFGRARAGIPFDAFDQQPVKFILLFLVPENQFERHIQTLAKIAKVFKGDQVLRDLATAPDAASIVRVLGARL
jgi:mannitol/fructose-specific phosphotransferase system IIA component (Ntr-type)